ncbi:hypothetical protein EJB05_35804 [Eragrostis curvula]|uniref:J domain-containing protein n=1 Tax=Eragrostis curvula TaxID=38414 RepID=A0A5J9U8W9_9POAL|nr:hypothetical protein EJB05_35804 [Eragrostis curvula]
MWKRNSSPNKRILRKIKTLWKIEGAGHLDRIAPAFTMILGSNICLQKTLYEILSVTEDATYDEIRAAYKSAALNTHPDKAQTTVEASVLSNEQQEFLSVQKAWEILRHPNSRAEYDKQLQSSRQNIEIISSEIEVGDMIVESTGDIVELLYPCRFNALIHQSFTYPASCS